MHRLSAGLGALGLILTSCEHPEHAHLPPDAQVFADNGVANAGIDAAIADGGTADIDVRDAAVREVEDLGPQPPADLGPTDPYASDAFLNAPPDHQREGQHLQVVEDMTERFDAWPFEAGWILYAGDLDGSGRAELYVWEDEVPRAEWLEDPLWRQRVVGVFERDGGAWVRRHRIRGFSPSGAFDLDGDGVAELLGIEEFVQRRGDGENATYSVQSAMGVRRATGGPWAYDERLPLLGSFSREGLWMSRIPNAGWPVATDLDRDGRPEVLAGGSQILEWNGVAFDLVHSGSDGSGSRTKAIGDLGGDGVMELIYPAAGPVVINSPESRAYHEHGRLVEVRGDDTYVEVGRIATGSNFRQVAAMGDIDGDGRDDLLVGGAWNTSYQVFSSGRDGRLHRLWLGHVEQTLFNDDGSTVLGDVDGDGDLEIVANLNGVLTVWNWAGGRFVQLFGERLCAEPCHGGRVFVSDLDGDGRAEIIASDVFAAVQAGHYPREPHHAARGVLVRSMRPD